MSDQDLLLAAHKLGLPEAELASVLPDEVQLLDFDQRDRHALFDDVTWFAAGRPVTVVVGISSDGREAAVVTGPDRSSWTLARSRCSVSGRPNGRRSD